MRTFRAFMEDALYAPESGFYRTRVPMEDFYTAPELHPAFGSLLAEEALQRLSLLESRGVPGPYCIVEMGSGSGQLARTIASYIKERRPEWAGRVVLVLVERCQEQLVGGVLAAAKTGIKVLGYERMADVPRCAGVFLSNELVDAFPVHLLEKRDGCVLEVYVQEKDGECVETVGELSDPELAETALRVRPSLKEGERHAVNLEARRWIREVSRVLSAGWVITVDYGRRMAASSVNPPRAYFRHTISGESLTRRSGRQDLTASVDFEDLASEGKKCGLQETQYSTQGKFLLDRGILEWMPASGSSSALSDYQQRNRIKTLFHPEGMGESFKVLIQEKLP